MVRKRRATPEERAVRLHLRLASGEILPLEQTKELQRLSMEWAYRVRNRRRWVHEPDNFHKVIAQAQGDLKLLGLDESAIDRLGNEEIVEVHIPYTSAELDWELRIFPWEFLLSSASYNRTDFSSRRNLAGPRQPLVVRHLRRVETDESVSIRDVGKVLVVISAPGRIEEEYSFKSEQKLIKANLQIEAGRGKEEPADVPRIEITSLKNPTQEELSTKVAETEPEIIHLTGVDSHEGAEFLGWAPERHRHDGMLFADAKGVPVLIKSEDLARCLNAAEKKPLLVTCSTFNSASRTCALAVAEGARAAIGFQDETKNALAEHFFATFFRAWHLSGHRYLDSFRLAMHEFRAAAAGKVKGSGIVLWSQESLLETEGAPQVGAAENLEAKLQRERTTKFEPAESTGTGDGGLHGMVGLDVKPLPALNYALLHNDQNLFERFTVRKFTQHAVRDLYLKVELFIGESCFRYQHSLELDRPARDLKDQIRVPLTWQFVRTLRESVRTGLRVEAHYLDKRIYDQTFPIRLLPVDVWRDTESDGPWLPSFVLSRDPAVGAVIDQGQRYLITLADDPAAGFDGYQGVDHRLADPCAPVEIQVRALWAALTLDNRLSYIEPPPTFRESSQRLRTPSDVIQGRRGTCIDLALLLASALEYAGIYPVIFLLKGHALPGFWRDPAAHDRLVTMLRDSDRWTRDNEDDVALGSLPSQQLAWFLSVDFYDEVLQALLDEALVPIETVDLTNGASFAEAVENGFTSLRQRSLFEGLIDVTQARRAEVTPLPLSGSYK